MTNFSKIQKNKKTDTIYSVSTKTDRCDTFKILLQMWPNMNFGIQDLHANTCSFARPVNTESAEVFLWQPHHTQYTNAP